MSTERLSLNEIQARAAAGTLVGAFPNIPAEIYHGCTNYLSATQIGAWLRSERHYEALLAGTALDSDALEKGRLLHLAVGEPSLFKREVAIGPEVNRNTTIWKSFAAENVGRICKKPSEVEEILLIASQVHAHPQVGPMFHGALVEWSFFGICPVTKMPVKCRPDLLTSDYLRLADLKSTRDAHPEEFPKDAFYLNYHIKMAHYMDVIQLVTGVRPELGIFIAAETKPPYEVVPFVPDKDQEFGIDPLEVGARTAREVRAKIAQRLQEKRDADTATQPFRWKGYAEGFVPMTLPRFAAKAEAEARGAL
ncbi:MAG: PD-(D/E)XK nuclease-like domain-containing protein [Bdellovibrionota bacterium]